MVSPTQKESERWKNESHKDMGRWADESPSSRWDDSVYGDNHAQKEVLFREYLAEMKKEGATDAQMLDAYNENLPLLKQLGDGFLPMRVNESKHMSTITNRYESADSTSDNAIGEALGKAIRHSRRVCMREHIKANRLEAVNQFIVSIRRELSYVRTRCSVEAFSHATNLLESKYTWHDIGVSADENYKVKEWLTIAKRKSYTADAQSELIQG
jgi:hypothetical protein